MSNYILDTNVLLVSSGKATQISLNDKLDCDKFVVSLYNNSVIYIDSKYLFFEEYFRKLNRSGQPGIGDAFAKWLYDNQYDTSVCKIVDIEPLNAEGTSFSSFSVPDDLKKFDLSDRKFVAVAIASSNIPEICNASDSDWWEFKEPLNKLGVKIKFICQEELSSWNS
jgi:hypothetical protein